MRDLGTGAAFRDARRAEVLFMLAASHIGNYQFGTPALRHKAEIRCNNILQHDKHLQHQRYTKCFQNILQYFTAIILYSQVTPYRNRIPAEHYNIILHLYLSSRYRNIILQSYSRYPYSGK